MLFDFLISMNLVFASVDTANILLFMHKTLISSTLFTFFWSKTGVLSHFSKFALFRSKWFVYPLLNSFVSGRGLIIFFCIVRCCTLDYFNCTGTLNNSRIVFDDCYNTIYGVDKEGFTYYDAVQVCEDDGRTLCYDKQLP